MALGFSARHARRRHHRRDAVRPLDASAQFQLGEQHSWIPQFGVSYALGVDGIALVLILMALVLTPICLLAAWRDVPEEAARAAASASRRTSRSCSCSRRSWSASSPRTDVFLFYVFFEAMLIPVYFLIGRFGGPRRQYAAMKFLLFSLAGGLVMLVAVIALYLAGPGRHRRLPHRAPHRSARSTRPPSGCSSSASSSPSRSRRRWCRSTPGCPTPPPSRTPGHGDAARRRARQGRHVRDDPLLPPALPRGEPVGDARRRGPRRHLGHLRRAARDRPDRHDAPRRPTRR